MNWIFSGIKHQAFSVFLFSYIGSKTLYCSIDIFVTTFVLCIDKFLETDNSLVEILDVIESKKSYFAKNHIRVLKKFLYRSFSYIIFLRDFSDYLVSRIQYVNALYEISFNIVQWHLVFQFNSPAIERNQYDVYNKKIFLIDLYVDSLNLWREIMLLLIN